MNEKKCSFIFVRGKSLFLLLVAGFSTGLITFFNATLVYDDIALPHNFYILQTQIGWLKTLWKIFCLDLPGEYRTYGVSRVIQYILWSIGFSSVRVYSIWIAVSQGITALFLTSILLSVRSEKAVALAAGLLWLFSPFVWTSCFHHYSYLIFPIQVLIIGLYFLRLQTDSLWSIFFSLALGFILALTGELHLVGSFLVLILMAFISDKRNEWRRYAIVIAAMIVTLLVHYFVWKIFVSNKGELQRFNVSGAHDASFWYHRVSIAVRGIFQSISNQLIVIVGENKQFVGLVAVSAAIFVYFLFRWSVAGKGKSLKILTNRGDWKISAVIFGMAIASLFTFVLVVVLTDSVPEDMPRRYGYVPLTFILISVTIWLSLIPRSRYFQVIVLSLLVGLAIAIFIQSHFFVIPKARRADDKISEALEVALKKYPKKAVMFFNASDKSFPKISLDAASYGPAMSETTRAEVTQSKYGTYWPFYTNATNVLGATLTCVLGADLGGGMVRLVCPTWQKNPGAMKKSDIIVIANLGFNEIDYFGDSVRIFDNFDDFEPYFFSKKILKDNNPAKSQGLDVLQIDLGTKFEADGVGDVLPDKKMTDSPPSNKAHPWLINYGLKSGDNSTYKYPFVGVNSEYFRTNRNGNFEYELVFSNSDLDLDIDLDFLELWIADPGIRVFDIQVSWNGGSWVSVGIIDPAQLNGNKPFSVHLSRQRVNKFNFRLVNTVNSKDVPFIQGVRIGRRAR
jgi:hypothetical protein